MIRDRVKIAQNVAAEIAQEMRNPVFGIVSAAQLLRYRVADDPVMEKNVGRILRESERLNALVTALLDYGRPEPIHLESGDPDAVWGEVLDRLRGALESRALLVRYTPADPRARCELDVEQLAQACTNALTNAIEAAPEGSDLTLQSTTELDGSWSVRLRNDGPPVSAEMLVRACEPLASDKDGHAGMGLATAARIVAEHGGAISLDNDVANGAVFIMTLPAARRP